MARVTKKSTQMHKEEVLRFTGGKIEPISEYVNKSVQVNYKCHVCGNEFKQIPNSMLQHFTCKCCLWKSNLLEIFNINSPEDYIREFNKVSDNRFTLVTEYVDVETKVDIMDKVCGQIISYYPMKFLMNPYCLLCVGGALVKYTDTSFKNRIAYVHKGKYLIEGDYIDIDKDVTVRCTWCCDTWDMKARDILKKAYVHSCSNSEARYDNKIHDDRIVEGTVSISISSYNILSEKSKLYDLMMQQEKKGKKKSNKKGKSNKKS